MKCGFLQLRVAIHLVTVFKLSAR